MYEFVNHFSSFFTYRLPSLPRLYILIL